MDFMGGITGMNFNPITNYNKMLKENEAFNVDSSSDFENVLNQQTAALENPIKVNGGVELNQIGDVAAQTAVQGTPSAANAGTLLDGFSKSINGGLTSVNDSVNAANKAQEALAMGEDVSVHDVMIASEKASLSLQMAMQLRNKLMSAYSEINNIKV